MNIIDVIRSTLGSGNTVNTMSSLLGLSQDQTQRATSATIDRFTTIDEVIDNRASLLTLPVAEPASGPVRS